MSSGGSIYLSRDAVEQFGLGPVLEQEQLRILEGLNEHQFQVFSPFFIFSSVA